MKMFVGALVGSAAMLLMVHGGLDHVGECNDVSWQGVLCLESDDDDDDDNDADDVTSSVQYYQLCSTTTTTAITTMT